MPPVSEAQRRAMEAAAHGHSTLGIPAKVGREFVGKDAFRLDIKMPDRDSWPDAPKPGERSGKARDSAAGVLFADPEGRVLLLHRSPAGDHPATWGLPGGRVENKETPEAAADREVREELGEDAAPTDAGRKALDRRVFGDVAFTTFGQPVEKPFAPTLNDEHDGYVWAPLNALPSPLHPGLAETLKEQLGVAEDMEPEDWKGLVGGLLKFLSEEEREPEHAQDGFALDKASVRRVDADGRLHVEVSNISKANVCPYLGKEIPDYEKLGLNPDRVYQLLRDPDELAKAAKSFDNIPLLKEHVPITVTDYDPKLIVGSTGTDAGITGPYLRNSLVIWDDKAIQGVESKKKYELSSAYRYKPDMTPGVTRDGVRYDGVMRDIIGNHVALVEEGRAGDDVVVGDSKLKLENHTMSKTVLSPKAAVAVGALLVGLRPLLAKDQKVNLAPIFQGVNAKNWKTSKPKFLGALDKALKGKLAKDANLADIHEMLDSLDKGGAEEEDEVKEEDLGVDTEAEAAEENATTTNDEEPWAKAKAHLAGKISEDDMDALDEIMGGQGAQDAGEDLLDDDKTKRTQSFGATPTRTAKDKVPGKQPVGLDKKAMDTALAVHGEKVRRDTLAQLNAIAEAREVVRPHVGALSMAVDSAEQVYEFCLKQKGVDLAGVPPAAYRAMVGLLEAKPRSVFAQDAAPGAAAVTSYDAMFGSGRAA